MVLSKELRPVDSPVQRDPDALTELERAELQRLRKEVIELRTDKEILRRAAAYSPGRRCGDPLGASSTIIGTCSRSSG